MHRTSQLTKCFKCTFFICAFNRYALSNFFSFSGDNVLFVHCFYFVGSFLLCLFGWLVDCISESSSLFLLLSPIVSQSS